jgi:hypothetical protein
MGLGAIFNWAKPIKIITSPLAFYRGEVSLVAKPLGLLSIGAKPL